MNRCRTCAHWNREFSNDPIVEPVDPDTYQPMLMPFEVRQCRQPALTFCERPVSDPGFGVCDGSEYMANLYTTAEFGCVLHEAKT